MIRIENVHKYFNRYKSNQIHVIDNTTLELPEKGIVTFLGPSGCGKTTLLNAIGGLDKVNKGKIFVDGYRITKRTAGKVDKLRNAKIGYIFQNFNLIDEQSVFDNVALALRMVGVRNKETIKKRVNYCLEAVGIYAYRNKLAGALSGGQRQRVAIARAIVKNPMIIIADEPTGNLDSANTLEIMNLIKRLSKDRLVVLVTHEQDIAKFYSDRILRIVDGKVVSDEINENDGTLDYQLDNQIFLRDLPVAYNVNAGNLNVGLYADKKERDAKIKLVIRGNNIFIDTGGRYSVIDENSDIELIDEHYTAIDQSVFEKSTFDYNRYMPEKFKPRYRRVCGWGRSIVQGLAAIRKFRALKKILMFGFILAALFCFYATSNIAGILDIQRADFMKTDEHYVTVANPGKNMKVYNKVKGLEESKYILPGTSKIAFTLPMDDYYQTSSLSASISGSLVPIDTITESDLIKGRMPESSREIVVDKMILKKFIASKQGISVGITKYTQLLDRRLTVNHLSDFKIVGISDTQNPSLYVSQSKLMDLIQYAPVGNEEDQGGGLMGYQDGFEGEEYAEDNQVIMSYKHAPKGMTIKRGRKPEKAYEVLVNNSHYESEEMKLNKSIPAKMAGKKLTVVGFYTSNTENDDTYYVTPSTIKLDNYHKFKKISIYSDDPQALKDHLESEGIAAKVNIKTEKKSYMNSVRKTLKSSLITAGIILLISLIEIFLMLRSSFLARIREVGTLRAIGLKKADIYRIFGGEIVAITVITSVIGIGAMYYILHAITKASSYYQSLYMVNPLVALATFGVLLLFNLLIGLLPVFFTMRKTPAQILSRTDI